MEQGQRWWGPVGRGTEPPPPPPSPPRPRGNRRPKTPPGPRPAAPPALSRAPRPVTLRLALLLGAAPLVLALAAVLLTPGRWEAALGLLAVYAATCAAAAYRPGRARPGGTLDRPGATPEHPGPPALPSPCTTEPRPAATAPPAELPASLPAPRPAHDPAVTTFGLLLQAHPFVPAPGSPYQELAAWSRALEAYDEAGRAGAEQVPGILAEGRAALTTLDRLLGLDTPDAAPDCFFAPRHGPAAATVRWAPPHGAARTVEVCRADAARLADAEATTGPAHAPPAYDTCHGNGALRLTLRTPGDAAPLLLAFTCDTPRTVEVIAGSGRRGRVRLLRRQGPVGAVLPVPRGTATAAGLALDIRASGPWTATLLATAHTRDLGPSAEGTGPDILTKETRSRLVLLHHQGPGPFRVRRLYRDFRPGPVLAEGTGTARMELGVPGACLLQVEASGAWRLVDTAA
ncbi:hypothetical protein [Streptomyces albidoflavus]|uniref:hypothetical protein n=1 Tax=Streptomyces albidoflavus TaxID=1886 RepID=UPI00386CAA96|nr:hypothetical protein OH730_14855 [Streptomyces albidoflavus]WTD83066.1 hypothetical protein OHA92_15725 [Streptomyces albidoflavus]